MKIHIQESDLPVDSKGRHTGVALIGEQQGAVKGFCLGVSYYDSEEYGTPGVHADQEGFYVLEGVGTAKVGAEEFPVKPGCAFIAARGVPHTMKKDKGGTAIKVLWSHGAV